MEWQTLQVVFWVIAGLVSFYFSFGTARVWTSISIGFFLILIGEILPQAIPYLPGTGTPQVEAMASIVGTLAILILSHGFQEYYVFSRTLEVEGSKSRVYVGTLLVIAASYLFILINPEPEGATLYYIRLVENTNWVFLSLINIDLIRKIYRNVQDSPIAPGFLAFMAVFAFIFLWRGAELYLQVYELGARSQSFPVRYQISLLVGQTAGLLAGLSVGGTFLYLARQLR